MKTFRCPECCEEIVWGTAIHTDDRLRGNYLRGECACGVDGDWACYEAGGAWDDARDLGREIRAEAD